jgi:hypothetical protein
MATYPRTLRFIPLPPQSNPYPTLFSYVVALEEALPEVNEHGEGKMVLTEPVAA